MASSLFDAIIVGTGQATPSLTEVLVAAGWKVAVIEQNFFGGTRANACRTPIKSLLASAQVAHYNRRAEDFGIVPSIAVMVNMASVKRRIKAIVDAGCLEIENRLRLIDGCTVYQGHAEFISPSEIRVDESVLQASHIILNVGARPSVGELDVTGVPYFTSSTIVDLDQLPQKLIIVGGGHVGLAFAQIYRRFGADVTVVERSSRLVPREDRDASGEIQRILEAEGVVVCLDTECIEVQCAGDGIRMTVSSHRERSSIDASHLLLATGREPNTDDMAIHRAGIRLNEKGYIPVDMYLQSKVPGIWALGECNGRGALSDTSIDDSEIVAVNLLSDRRHSIADRISAYTVFTDPPLAQIGLTENQVRGLARPALIGYSRMDRVENAVHKSESSGFIKIFVDAESKRVLGVTILGTNADEATHYVRTAMEHGLHAQMLRKSTHTQPTIPDLIATLLGELKPLD